MNKIKEQIEKSAEEFDEKFSLAMRSIPFPRIVKIHNEVDKPTIQSHITASNKALGKVIIDMLEGEKKVIPEAWKKSSITSIPTPLMAMIEFNSGIIRAQSIIKEGFEID